MEGFSFGWANCRVADVEVLVVEGEYHGGVCDGGRSGVCHIVLAGVHSVRDGGCNGAHRPCRGACGQHQHVCGYLGWPDDEGEEQLVQLEEFHSPGRLDHELVLVGAMAELIQLTLEHLVQQLQLGVWAQDCDQVGGKHHRHLVQLKLAQLVQLQLNVQAYLDCMGGGQCHHFVLPSRQWELWQL